MRSVTDISREQYTLVSKIHHPIMAGVACTPVVQPYAIAHFACTYTLRIASSTSSLRTTQWQTFIFNHFRVFFFFIHCSAFSHSFRFVSVYHYRCFTRKIKKKRTSIGKTIRATLGCALCHWLMLLYYYYTN